MRRRRTTRRTPIAAVWHSIARSNALRRARLRTTCFPRRARSWRSRRGETETIANTHATRRMDGAATIAKMAPSRPIGGRAGSTPAFSPFVSISGRAGSTPAVSPFVSISGRAGSTPAFSPFVSISGRAGSTPAFSPIAGEGDSEVGRLSMTEIAVDLSELEVLIDDILTATRLEISRGPSGAAQFELHRQEIAAGALCERAAERFRSMHPGRPLDLDVPADLPAIEVDPVLLRRVFDNLLQNAHKYSPDPSRPRRPPREARRGRPSCSRSKIRERVSRATTSRAFSLPSSAATAAARAAPAAWGSASPREADRRGTRGDHRREQRAGDRHPRARRPAARAFSVDRGAGPTPDHSASVPQRPRAWPHGP